MGTKLVFWHHLQFQTMNFHYRSLLLLVLLLFAWPDEALPRQNMSFLAVSDIHLDIDKQSPSGHDNENTGPELWKQATEKIRALLKGPGTQGDNKWSKPAFLLCLGDLPLHTTNVAAANKNRIIVLQTLEQIAKDEGVPFIYAPGNNDPEKGRYEEMPTATLCTAAFPLGKAGKLKVLALNSVVFTAEYRRRNKNIAKEQLITALATLDIELGKAVAEGQKVLIMMHIPPGTDAFKGQEMWDSPEKYDMGFVSPQNAFLNIITPYRRTVVGILASHTHMDGLSLLYDRQNKFNNLLISVPGIDPGHGNNPAVKLFTFQPSTFEINDFITFYNNYYPGDSVKPWLNDHYSFRRVFKCRKGMPIRSCIEELVNSGYEQLRRANQDIYKVHGMPDDMDACRANRSFVVKWQDQDK